MCVCVYVDYTKHNKFSIYYTKAKPHGTLKHFEKIFRFYHSRAFECATSYVFANSVYYVYEYKYV